MLQPVPFYQLDTMTLLPSPSSWKHLIITNPNTMSWNRQSLFQKSVQWIYTTRVLLTRSPATFSSVLLSISLPCLLKVPLTSVIYQCEKSPLFCKDSHGHFTIHLQICHQTIMLQVKIVKHFWKQIRCYTDITVVTGTQVTLHLRFHILSNL